MKRTAFYDRHRALGAKMVEFAGFEMPVQYPTGIVEEHKRVRAAVGLFDVSHMGELEVYGPEALAFVQKVTVNDVAKLTPGRVQYSAMCYDNGGIVDDVLVYCLEPQRYMLVINAANIEKDVAWLNKHRSGNVTLDNRSDAMSLLAVQGPHSRFVLQKLTSLDLSTLPYYHCTTGELAGVSMLISRTGYTGELGYELYFPSDVVTGKKVWDAIMEAGKEFAITPVGLGARDTLRLEMGFCLYGNDIDQTTHPLEAGLGWITKLDKGEFLGRAALMKAKAEGLRRRLVGFTLSDKAFPRHGYSIHANGKKIGDVTSGTFSPILEQGIGMGYVGVDYAQAGTALAVNVRGKEVPAVVTTLPFVKKS
ncbi:MAG: glycine cleavage system protein T [Ignavibacteria bacterium]